MSDHEELLARLGKERRVHSRYGDQRTPHFPQESYCVSFDYAQQLTAAIRELTAQLAAERKRANTYDEMFQAECKKHDRTRMERMQADAKLARVDAAIKVCEQASMEMNHAHFNPQWFTRGHQGTNKQFILWRDKAIEAIRALQQNAAQVQDTSQGMEHHPETEKRASVPAPAAAPVEHLWVVRFGKEIYAAYPHKKQAEVYASGFSRADTLTISMELLTPMDTPPDLPIIGPGAMLDLHADYQKKIREAGIDALEWARDHISSVMYDKILVDELVRLREEGAK